jgi:hypothetical protein
MTRATPGRRALLRTSGPATVASLIFAARPGMTAASPAGSSGDGRWAGRGRQIMLVVLSADETAGIADIVYAQGGPTEHSYNAAPPVFVRRLARLQNGGLEFLAFYGWRYTFRLASDDELEGWYLAPMQAHAAAGRGLIRVHRVE